MKLMVRLLRWGLWSCSLDLHLSFSDLPSSTSVVGDQLVTTATEWLTDWLTDPTDPPLWLHPTPTTTDETDEAFSDDGVERRLSGRSRRGRSLPTGPVRSVFLRHLDATPAPVVQPRQLKVPAGKKKTAHFIWMTKNWLTASVLRLFLGFTFTSVI